MPIWHNEQDKVLMVELGFADVRIAKAGKDGREDEIVFIGGKQGKMGEVNVEDIGKNTLEVGAACRIVFHNVESLDVLAEQLASLRASMVKPPAPQESVPGELECTGPFADGKTCPKCKPKPPEPGKGEPPRPRICKRSDHGHTVAEWPECTEPGKGEGR